MIARLFIDLRPRSRGSHQFSLGTIPIISRRLGGGACGPASSRGTPVHCPSDVAGVSHIVLNKGTILPAPRRKIIDEAGQGAISMHWRRQVKSGSDVHAHQRPGIFRLAVLTLIAFALWRKKRDHTGI